MKEASIYMDARKRSTADHASKKMEALKAIRDRYTVEVQQWTHPVLVPGLTSGRTNYSFAGRRCLCEDTYCGPSCSLNDAECDAAQELENIDADESTLELTLNFGALGVSLLWAAGLSLRFREGWWSSWKVLLGMLDDITGWIFFAVTLGSGRMYDHVVGGPNYHLKPGLNLSHREHMTAMRGAALASAMTGVVHIGAQLLTPRRSDRGLTCRGWGGQALPVCCAACAFAVQCCCILMLGSILLAAEASGGDFFDGAGARDICDGDRPDDPKFYECWSASDFVGPIMTFSIAAILFLFACVLGTSAKLFQFACNVFEDVPQLVLTLIVITAVGLDDGGVAIFSLTTSALGIATGLVALCVDRDVDAALSATDATAGAVLAVTAV